MKSRVKLVDILIAIEKDKCEPFVCHLYVVHERLTKILYGMLKLSLLHHKKFTNDINEIGCKENQHETHAVNKIINQKITCTSLECR